MWYPYTIVDNLCCVYLALQFARVFHIMNMSRRTGTLPAAQQGAAPDRQQPKPRASLRASGGG
jgi:hypothetical protein